MSETDKILEMADGLLEDWWFWSRQYFPNLGVPRISPYCRESGFNRQWDSTHDVTEEMARRTVMHAVDFCVNSLPVKHAQAIGIEMRNRSSNAKVWRSEIPYQDALEAILPIMQGRNLVERMT